jgi:response regulator of citrate/malate metabolism
MQRKEVNAMDYAQYKNLRDEIESDYKKKKEALEMLWSMYHKSSPHSPPTTKGSRTPTSDIVRQIIAGLKDEFTADDIQQGLKDYNLKNVSRLSINNTLHRLWRRKEIDVIKKGQGRMPSLYKKINQSELTT